jgi:hypothetical protein
MRLRKNFGHHLKSCFEIGVALIGASVTAYLLGILLNRQQSSAKKWRSELRKRIKHE